MPQKSPGTSRIESAPTSALPHLLGRLSTDPRTSSRQRSFIVLEQPNPPDLDGSDDILHRRPPDRKAHAQRLRHVRLDVLARQVAYLIERGRAEAALRESNEQLLWLASVVESSEDLIITKNLDGIITSWNKAAKRVFGYTAQEAVGKPITILTLG